MFSATLSNLRQMGQRKSPNPVAIQLTKAEKWKMWFTIVFAKVLGVFIIVTAMKVLPSMIASTAYAQEVYTPHETVLMNTANTIWTLVAAFLVFGMQAGFVMLEAGFARKRETVNVLVECVLDTAICGISFWAILQNKQFINNTTCG